MPDAPSSPRSCVMVGHVCIDDNEVEGARATTWGSSCCFISHYLRETAPGISPRILAPYGADFLPYRDDAILLNPPHPGPTMRYRNVVRRDERTQWCEHPDQPMPELDANALAQIARAATVFVAPLAPTMSAEWVGRVLDAATGTTVLLPQGLLRSIGEDGLVTAGDPAFAEAFSAGFDFVIFSDEDTPDALGMALRITQRSPDTVAIVTRNRAGATVVRAGRPPLNVPAVPLGADGVRNPIGAGDVFSAAFGVATARGLGPVEAVEAAHLAAARHISGRPVSD